MHPYMSGEGESTAVSSPIRSCFDPDPLGMLKWSDDSCYGQNFWQHAILSCNTKTLRQKIKLHS